MIRLIVWASAGVVSRATSLSKTYCSFIKRALRVPHPRHWPVLLELAAAAQSVPTSLLRGRRATAK
jgi:hypothetical protein